MITEPPERRATSAERAATSAERHQRQVLFDAAERALQLARTHGASDAEVEVSTSSGLGVTVRKGEVETVEHTRDRGLTVTVYFGARKGAASSTDLADESLQSTVRAACAIARFTAEDPANGLPEPELLAHGPFADLSLYHPWNVPVETAIEIARETEAAAFAVDSRITNSEGATVGWSDSDFVLANSRGFCAGVPSTRASISAAVIAQDKSGMQRDYWFTSERDPRRMQSAAEVGRMAGERAVRRLNGRRLGTLDVPVLFEANCAGSLLGHFVGAASGSALYRKASFLIDHAGKPVFSPCVNITEDPHIPAADASTWFDAEGVATHKRMIVDRGVLTGYFLSTYSARKLNLKPTGNSGGNHNLIASSTGESFDALLKKMQRGVLVTELMGQGINTVTGDYSRGCSGFWVEGGEIAYPIEEVTIAGNLKDMFRGVVAVGNDQLTRGARTTGSILIDHITVAGQ